MADDQAPGIGKITFSITTNGNRYDMRMGDFSAADEMAFKQVTGKSLMTAFTGEGDMDSITVAGLVWLFRRRHGEKRLQLQTVAEQLKWSDIDTVEIDDGTEAGDQRPEGLPEAVPSPES